ncbi:MAG: hypothetical protein QMB63_05530 [Clostridiaceae bacterium]
MGERHGMFEAKLVELEEHYEKLYTRIEISQNMDKKMIDNAMSSIVDEISENEAMLESRIKESRSKSVSELSQIQMEYINKTFSIYKRDKDQSEDTAALYAEYAIDFATEAMRHALLASLYAISLDKEKENQNETGEI